MEHRFSVKQKILLSLWVMTFLMLTLAGALASFWFTSDQAKRLDDFLVRESLSVRDLMTTYLNASNGRRSADRLSGPEFQHFAQDYFQMRVNRPLPYKTTLGVFDRAGNPVLVTNSALNLASGELAFSLEIQLVTVPGNRPYRLASVPLVHNSELVGSIRLACLTVTLAETWDSFLFSLALVLALVFLSFGLLGTLLLHWSLLPIRELSESAKQISESHLDLRLTVPAGNDEIARMAQTLNHLLEKIERDYEFEESLIGQLSHELRTPLSVLRARNEMALERRQPGPEVWELLEDNIADIDQIVSLLNTLLSLASMDGRRDLVEWRQCDLSAILEDLIEELVPLWREKDLSFHLSLPGKETSWARCRLLSRGDPTLLRQAFLNILTNAFKYTPRGSRIHIAVEEDGAPPNPMWRLVFRNSGPPIPEESLEMVFKRFYRVEVQDPDRFEAEAGLGQRGFGLGLSISKAMVDLHHGTIRAFNPPKGGAAFEVRLPRLLSPQLG